MPERHPRLRLDDNFASPIRFSLMAALLDGNELDFKTLAEVLQVGDSALSKSISHLQVTGYVTTRRGEVGSRPRTWVCSTAKGERAFTAHLQALQEIVEFGARPS